MACVEPVKEGAQHMLGPARPKQETGPKTNI